MFHDPYGEILAPRIVNGTVWMNEQIRAGKKVMFEGAQGTMLDVDHGTYPFVTSSSTIVGGICSGLGAAPKHIHKVIGVGKAYTTRVGGGAFPTELDDAGAPPGVRPSCCDEVGSSAAGPAPGRDSFPPKLDGDAGYGFSCSLIKSSARRP